MLVEVVNGTGAPDQATEVATVLREVGFAINGTANAPSFQNAMTVVAYPPGEQSAAATVAAYLVGDYELQANDQLPSGVIDLVTGESWDGVRG
ncbi:MAG TPA: LytR C-terminal domain-containing protein [Acidimicrobiales bacterium]|nr:LytR C-terminal domain-containing protein [Acidimicrobiales bacterium]